MQSDAAIIAGRRRILLGLNLASFFWAVGLGAAIPVVPLFSYQFTPSVALAGLVTAIGGAGTLVAGYIAGPLVDRYGRRRVTIIGITIRMVFSFGEGLAFNYASLALFRLLSGVGTAIWATGIAVITADISTRRDRGSIAGGRTLLAQLGNVAGPAIGGFAWAVTDNIRVPFFINGGTKVLCLLIFIFVMRETGVIGSGAVKRRRGGDGQAEAIGGRRAWPLLVGAFLLSGWFVVLYGVFADGLFRQGITNVVFPVYMRNVLGMSRAEVGYVISAVSLGMALASVPAGRITDHWGTRPAIILGALTATAGLLWLAHVVTASVPVWLALTIGAGTGMIGVGVQAYSIDLAPTGGRGRYFGQLQLARNSATLVGPLVLGFFAERVGYAEAFVLLAAIYGALVLLTLLPRKR